MSSKTKYLNDIYKDIGLTIEQKKQLHFMLLRVQDLSDVKALSNISYNEIEDMRCCLDAMCVCGSRVKPFRQRVAEEAMKSIPISVFEEIKTNSRSLAAYSDKLQKLKEKIGYKTKIEEHFDENSREEQDLRELLHFYKTKIKDLIFELHLTTP